LGRFCVVAGAARVEGPGYAEFQFNGGVGGSGLLPYELTAHLRMLSRAGDFARKVHIPGKGVFQGLAAMNDSLLMSFKEIAQYMRHDPWNIFRHPDDVPPASNPEPIKVAVSV
jgi:hypothetical protein